MEQFSLSIFDANIGVERGSALSSVLSALYLSLLFHIFEKCVKNLKIPVLFLSFVNDGLLVSQEKSLKRTNSFFFAVIIFFFFS